MHELIRRAIFIELPTSRGKEDGVRRTLRWQLRSSFLPSFGASLVRDSYIDIKTIDAFVDLLVNPERSADQIFQRYGTAAPTKPLPHDMFSDLENDMDVPE